MIEGKPERSWSAGKVIKCGGRWYLVLEDGRRFVLPKTYTATEKDERLFWRMIDSAGSYRR